MLLAASCNLDPAAGDNGYFDTRAYFTSEIRKLSRDDHALHKILTYKNASATNEISRPDWTEELASFNDIDLSKPAYTGLFKKDSTILGDITRVNYSANGNSDIRSVSLLFRGSQQPEHVVIRLAEDNLLYSSEKTLEYYKDSLYRITGKQSILLFPGSDYGVTGIFNSGGRSPQP